MKLFCLSVIQSLDLGWYAQVAAYPLTTLRLQLGALRAKGA